MGSDTVLIGADLARQIEVQPGTHQRRQALRAAEHLPQLAVATQVRNEEIDVDRLAVLTMQQGHRGAAAEVAVTLRQHLRLQ